MGSRAHLETTKMKALEYMARLHVESNHRIGQSNIGRLLKMRRPEPDLRQLPCSSLPHVKSEESVSFQLGGIN